LSETFHDAEDSVATGLVLQALGGAFFLPGTYILSQSESGRNILAGEIVVATAVATWYCGGCGAGVGAFTRGVEGQVYFLVI